MRRSITILVTAIASTLASGQTGQQGDNSPRPAPRPSALFARLGDANAAAAFQAMRRLELLGPSAVTFLNQRLTPVDRPRPERIVALIDDLSAESYHKRTAAFAALLEMGPVARNAVQRALTGRVCLAGKRRLKTLLVRARHSGPQTLAQQRRLRALRALERIGTAEALTAIRRIAGGTPEARLTAWATTAANRLAIRLAGEPGGAMAGGDIGRSGCFDGNAVRKPGKLAWKLDLGEYRYPATSIVVHDGVAYFGVDHADVGPMICTRIYAVDLKTRRVLWTHGHSEQTILDAPAVSDGTVYFCSASDGALHALDARTGRHRWQVDSGRAAVACPVVDGPTVYFGSNDGRFRAVDTQFGRMLWSVDLDDALNMPAALSEKYAIIPAGRTMHAVDRQSGKVLWTHSADLMVGAPAVRDGRAYFTRFDRQDGRGRIVAIELADGKTAWSVPVQNASPFAPAVGDGVVYAPGTDRRKLLAIDAAKGTVRWKVALPSETWQSPVTAGSMVYLVGREEGNLLAVDAKRRKLRWTFDTHSRRATGSPAVADGTLYVPSRHWKLLAVTERSPDDDTPAVATTTTKTP
ncbi:MAG: PQQ-binding-like beta-propeller repeat protein [Planctomycetota bacterium]